MHIDTVRGQLWVWKCTLQSAKVKMFDEQSIRTCFNVTCSHLDGSDGSYATILTTYLGSSFFIPDTIAVRILCDWSTRCSGSWQKNGKWLTVIHNVLTTRNISQPLFCYVKESSKQTFQHCSLLTPVKPSEYTTTASRQDMQTNDKLSQGDGSFVHLYVYSSQNGNYFFLNYEHRPAIFPVS